MLLIKGSFRYASCALQRLKDCFDEDEIEEELDSLPRGINGIYDDALSQITEKHQIKAATLLKWLLVSMRPLRMEEVVDCLLVDERDGRLVVNSRKRTSHAALFRLCPLLISTYDTFFWDPKDETQFRTTVFHLAHASVKEYLFRDWLTVPSTPLFRTTEAACQDLVAETRALFLLEQAKPRSERRLRPKNFQLLTLNLAPIGDSSRYTGKAEARVDLVSEDVYDTFPILAYAAKYWPLHVQKCSECIQARDEMPLELPSVMELLTSEELMTNSWELYHQRTPEYSIYNWRRNQHLKSEQQGSGHVSSFKTRKEECVRDLPSNVVVDVPSLYAAVFFRLRPVVRWLLDKGLVYDGSRRRLPSALQLAIIRGFPEIAKDLVEAGSDVNEKIGAGYNHSSPIQAAIASDDAEMLRYLCARVPGGDILQTLSGNAMALAISEGTEIVVESILNILPADSVESWVHDAIELSLCRTGTKDKTIKVLLDKAEALYTKSDAKGIISPSAVMFAARRPSILERCPPMSPVLDDVSLNTALLGLGTSFFFGEQLFRLTRGILQKARPGNFIWSATIGQFVLLRQPKSLFLLLARTDLPEPELEIFADKAWGSGLQFPGLIGFDYNTPRITKLLVDSIHAVPTDRTLDCYLADWMIARHAGTKPPILVLDPPIAIHWSAFNEWNHDPGTPENNLQPWGEIIISVEQLKGRSDDGMLNVTVKSLEEVERESTVELLNNRETRSVASSGSYLFPWYGGIPASCNSLEGALYKGPWEAP